MSGFAHPRASQALSPASQHRKVCALLRRHCPAPDVHSTRKTRLRDPLRAIRVEAMEMVHGTGEGENQRNAAGRRVETFVFPQSGSVARIHNDVPK